MFLTTCLFGQDTVQLDPSIRYSTKAQEKIPEYGRTVGPLAREVIVFSETHKRVEYCYYIDNKRHCTGDNYELKSDSVLNKNEEVWIYQKQGDQYLLHRTIRNTYEWGYAKNLVPLVPEGIYYTSTGDRKDTLWTSDYRNFEDGHHWDFPIYAMHKTKISGEVYEPKQLDQVPTRLNGDSIKPIHLERRDICINEPLYFMKTLTFVITAQGRVVNIEQGFGNFEMYCPYYIMDLMRAVLQEQYLKPGKRKGKEVNVRWTMPVSGSTRN